MIYRFENTDDGETLFQSSLDKDSKMVISVKKDMAVYFSRLTKIIGHAFFD